MMNWKMLFAMLAGSAAWGSPFTSPTVDYRRRRPKGSQLRNPADPVQAARIEAAAAKREARAEKLTLQMKRTVANSAHFGFLYEAHDERVYGVPDRLNPFHVSL